MRLGIHYALYASLLPRSILGPLSPRAFIGAGFFRARACASISIKAHDSGIVRGPELWRGRSRPFSAPRNVCLLATRLALNAWVWPGAEGHLAPNAETAPLERGLSRNCHYVTIYLKRDFLYFLYFLIIHWLRRVSFILNGFLRVRSLLG